VGVTEVERERVEARLQARQDEIVRTRAAVRRSSEGMRDSELSHVDNHPGDTAGELHDEEVDETTEIFFEEEERRIEEARRALADGTYGTCKSCGRDIPAERLEAVPEAVLCLECQRHFEALHRQRIRV
jgi:RNA polymerase-binding transcription factor DksA